MLEWGGREDIHARLSRDNIFVFGTYVVRWAALVPDVRGPSYADDLPRRSIRRVIIGGLRAIYWCG